MLKVLHYVSKMDRAGQEPFIMNLFRIQFDFLCTYSSKGDFDEEIFSLGGNIYYTSPINISGSLKQVQIFFSLVTALRKHRCDVFHIHTHHAMAAFRDALAARLCGVKTVVVHSHNTSALYHLRAHHLFKRFLNLLRIRRFACSKAAGAWMFTKNNFTVIHNGMDLDTIYFREDKRTAVRESLGWNGKKIIGHVGRFNEQKNHRFLIEIFAELHRIDDKTHLVLVGKGDLEEEIRDLVEKKNLCDSVSFLGVRDDVKNLYQGMDMLLFPSLFEGLSVVLVEAQACDLPGLISDTNSEETLLTNRLVMKSLQDSAKSWADEASRILETSESRRDNHDEIRQSGYDISILAQELEDIYLK